MSDQILKISRYFLLFFENRGVSATQSAWIAKGARILNLVLQASPSPTTKKQETKEKNLQKKKTPSKKKTFNFLKFPK